MYEHIETEDMPIGLALWNEKYKLDEGHVRWFTNVGNGVNFRRCCHSKLKNSDALVPLESKVRRWSFIEHFKASGMRNARLVWPRVQFSALSD